MSQAKSQKQQDWVSISPDKIREVAKSRMGKEHFFSIVLRQAWTEASLIVLRGVNFRYRNNVRAREAYAQMKIREFKGINARQQWANWRTIPQNLSGKILNRPLHVIDLCCGIGQSTEVLAYYLPLGSQILGLEYNPEFVQAASEGKYLASDGSLVDVTFRKQSVLETFLGPDGSPVRSESIDLVNSCGAVGSHFDSKMTQTLAQEVARVLKPGGVAMIDSGLPGTSQTELVQIFESLGFKAVSSAKSCFLDLYTQVCLIKSTSDSS